VCAHSKYLQVNFETENIFFEILLCAHTKKLITYNYMSAKNAKLFLAVMLVLIGPVMWAQKTVTVKGTVVEASYIN